MKYFTKEWYELCQRTDLHSNMRVYDRAAIYDEQLYLRLYKREEKEYLQKAQELYDVDPRAYLERDKSIFIPLEQIINLEEIKEGHKIVIERSPKEIERMHQLIEEYDTRVPFDEKACKKEFRDLQDMLEKEAKEKLPYEISNQIADLRVFALGYCTKEVYTQLIIHSKENEKIVQKVTEDYSKVAQLQEIPMQLLLEFGFHDCIVTEFTSGKDVVIRMNIDHGMAVYNKVTFSQAKIIKKDEQIVGSFWIYDELYKIEGGYEVHVLFAENGMPELIIQCEEIVLEEE